MSLLSQQSAINPTANFWAKNGLVPPSPVNLPFFVNSVGDNFSDIIITNGNYQYISDPINFPTLPYDVRYVITGYINLTAGGVDTGDFEVQISGTGIVRSSPCNFSASKGWFGMPLAVDYIVPATIDAESVVLNIFNNSGDSISFTGNCYLNAVGYPITP